MIKLITQVILKFKNFREIIRVDPATRRFKKYIKKNFHIKKPIKSNSKVLVESGQASSNLLSLSLFLPVLSEITQSELVAYSMMKNTRFTRIKESLRNRNSILYSVGTKKHLIISGNTKKRIKIEKIFDSISDPFKLENFELEEIKIGDLIYDTYLRQSKQPTINFTDPIYKAIFMECVEYFYNLKYVFDRYEIKAVCVSHTVYHFAIPLRIAISRKISAFQVTGEAIYRLDSEKTHAYTEFKNYREKFQKLSSVDREAAKNQARERLNLRLSGQVGIDMPYSTASAFSKGIPLNLKNKNEDIKILIATHDFFDSPHSYGDNLFPDFYIWLETLGKISEQTEYMWFIKSHRDAIADDSEILNRICQKFPKFNLLNPETSHQEIVASGVNFVLTVYGTIAMEYPLLGGIAINASINNPHANYSFSVTPSNVNEFVDILLNLENYRKEPNLDEVFEYYAMAHVLNCKSWIYYDYEKYLRKIGGYQNSISVKCYDHFMREIADRRTTLELQKTIRIFLNSGDYKLGYEHFKISYA